MTPHLTGTPVIETERLVLRAPQPADWPHWRDFAATPRATWIGGPMDLAKAWRAFAHVAGMWALAGFGSFVVAAKGAEDRPIGLCGPWRPVEWPEPELGWSLWSAAVEGRGYAAEAAVAARDFAFRELGWPTAVSYINPANARSIRLAERLGARLDPDAARHDPNDLVYRHPAPEERS